MSHAFVCDAVRTPFGRFGGALATVRGDELAAVPIAALMRRNSGVNWAAVEDVMFGCTNRRRGHGGFAPRIMGMGTVPAARKVMAQTELLIGDFDVIELNEAFAAQGQAVLRELVLPDDALHINPNAALLRWAPAAPG